MNIKHLGRLVALAAVMVTLTGCKAVGQLSSFLPDATTENSKADTALINTRFSIDKYPQNYMTVDNNKPVFEGAFARTVSRNLKDPNGSGAKFTQGECILYHEFKLEVFR